MEPTQPSPFAIASFSLSFFFSFFNFFYFFYFGFICESVEDWFFIENFIGNRDIESPYSFHSTSLTDYFPQFNQSIPCLDQAHTDYPGQATPDSLK